MSKWGMPAPEITPGDACELSALPSLYYHCFSPSRERETRREGVSGETQTDSKGVKEANDQIGRHTDRRTACKQTCRQTYILTLYDCMDVFYMYVCLPVGNRQTNIHTDTYMYK